MSKRSWRVAFTPQNIQSAVNAGRQLYNAYNSFQARKRPRYSSPRIRRSHRRSMGRRSYRPYRRSRRRFRRGRRRGKKALRRLIQTAQESKFIPRTRFTPDYKWDWGFGLNGHGSAQVKTSLELTAPVASLVHGTNASTYIGQVIHVHRYRVQFTLRPYEYDDQPPVASMIRIVIGYKKRCREDPIEWGESLMMNSGSPHVFTGQLNEMSLPNNTNDLRILKSRTFHIGHSTVAKEHQIGAPLRDISDQKYKSSAVWTVDLARYLGRMRRSVAHGWRHKSIFAWAFYVNPNTDEGINAEGGVAVDVTLLDGRFKDA